MKKRNSTDEVKNEKRSKSQANKSGQTKRKKGGKEEKEPSLIKIPTVAERALVTDILKSDEWTKERKCLQMLLESRVLLRELVLYKMTTAVSDDLSLASIKRLIGMVAEHDDDTDYLSQIQSLREQIVLQIRNNQKVERDLTNIEKKITLLIQNRTSIAEIEREAKKKRKKMEEKAVQEDFSKDSARLQKYSNLFYLLQTRPQYLAELAYLISSAKRDRFISTIILSLYGDAFSPREEFLLLTLFKLAISKEINVLKNANDLTQADSVVPKMILTYNKRKEGLEYIRTTLTGPIMKVIENSDFNANDDKQFYATLEEFLDHIIKSLPKIPYGLRLICKQILQLLKKKFPETSEEDFAKILGFWIYFKFLNPAIFDPSSVAIIPEDQVDQKSTANLVEIGRVLHVLFEMRTFQKGKPGEKHNNWILENQETVSGWLKDLVDVQDPEDFLKMDVYAELYSKTTPVVILTLYEMAEMQSSVKEHLDALTSGDDDPLIEVINSLGPVPHVEEDNVIEVQLELRSSMSLDQIEKQVANKDTEILEQTKELVIKVLRVTPVDAATLSDLRSLLKAAKSHSKQANLKNLSATVDKINENLEILENAGLVDKENKYAEFMKSVTVEAMNRVTRREQQKKEVEKLKQTLSELTKHYGFIKDRLVDLEAYLESCREKLATNIKSRKKNPKPVKFSFKELQKQNVILDCSVPDPSKSGMKFLISMPEIGQFEIEAKMGGIPVGTSNIELETLLEMKDSGQYKLEREHVTLSVVHTILLMNKHFLR